MTTASATELDGLFLHELQAANENVDRMAALAVFQRLRPNNHVTVDQLLTAIKRPKQIWAIMGSLKIVEFAKSLTDDQAPSAARPRRRRMRISYQVKNNLKGTVLRMLASHADGMRRTEVAAVLIAEGLVPPGIERAALPERVRQTLRELVAEGELHPV